MKSLPVICKTCGSNAVVRYGRYRQVQRYWCKSCRRKFRIEPAGFRMKTSTAEISRSLDLYYRGTGVEEIREILESEYFRMPAKRTLFQWAEKYSGLAAEATRGIGPAVTGDTWIADETVIRIGGLKVWIFDLQDEKTRFLLASRITPIRSTGETRAFLQEAYHKAGKAPVKIITDSYISYLIGSENTFKADEWQVPAERIALETDARRIDLFHATLRDRTTVLKRLKTLDSAGRFNAGWLAYYNFFRTNEAADNCIPAVLAGISSRWKSWEDIINGAPST